MTGPSLARLVALALLSVPAADAARWIQDYPEARLRDFRAAQQAWAAGRHARARAFYRRAARLPPGTDPTLARAAARLNHHRMHARLAPVLPHPQVAASAQAHAAYLARHAPPGGLSLRDAHGEVRGRPGFTGEGPGDRLEHQGVRASTTEGVSSETDPEAAVDHLMNSVYHRSGLLRQEARFLGFGAGTRSVIVLAWGRADEDEGEVWVYPGPGQAEVPPRFPGGETPEPLPGREYPVGPPLSVATRGGPPSILAARLEGPEGEVGLEVLREGTAPRADLMGDWVYLVPLRPLQAEAEYRLGLKVRRGRETWTRRVSFRTGTEVPGEDTWHARVLTLDHQPAEARAGTPLRFTASLELSHPELAQLTWSVGGEVRARGTAPRFEFTPTEPGLVRVSLRAGYGEVSEAYGERTTLLQVLDAQGRSPPPQAGDLARIRAENPGADLWVARILSLDGARSPLRAGEGLDLSLQLEATHRDQLRIRWTVGGQVVQDGPSTTLAWRAAGRGEVLIEARAYFPETPGAYATHGIYVWVQ